MLEPVDSYGEAMLRDGPIPRFVHGILEYALGVLFIAAPFLFDFKSGSATGMSVAVGVLILILAAVSEGPVSLVNQLPVLLHVAVVYLLSIFLIAAPFLLGFSDEVPPRNFFIISGVLLLLITIGTRFRRSEPDSGAGKAAVRRGRTTDRPAPDATAQDTAPPDRGSSRGTDHVAPGNYEVAPGSYQPAPGADSSPAAGSPPQTGSRLPPLPGPTGRQEPPAPPSPA